MDAKAATAKAISSREASRATVAALIMDVAAEAVADATKVAVEEEPSRALSCTMR